MRSKCIVLTISFLYMATAIGVAAEKKGILIPQTRSRDSKVSYVAEPVSRGATQIQSENSDEAGFIEVYANEKEIGRLKRLVEKKNREIAVLQGQLKDALDDNRDLEVQLYSMSTDVGIHYEVKKGDSLWKIAKSSEIYGDPLAWVKIYNANMDRIQDPNLIYPGQLLRIK